MRNAEVVEGEGVRRGGDQPDARRDLRGERADERRGTAARTRALACIRRSTQRPQSTQRTQRFLCGLCELCVVTSSTLYGRDHRRHDLEQIADDAVVGDLEDRRVGILVDRDDGARRPSCRPGAESRRRCRARDTASARRSARSCRPDAPSAASRRRRSAATRRSRRRARRPAAARAAMFACSLMPRPTDTIRSACDRSTACLACWNGGSGFCANRRRRRRSTLERAHRRRRRCPSRPGRRDTRRSGT